MTAARSSRRRVRRRGAGEARRASRGIEQRLRVEAAGADENHAELILGAGGFQPLEQAGLHLVADIAVEPSRPQQGEGMPAAMGAAYGRAQRRLPREQRLEADRPDAGAALTVEVRR